MKINSLFSKTSFCLFFVFGFVHFSFGQNLTSGGEIGYDQEILIGQQPDTLFNVTSASGGDTTLEIQYVWLYGTEPNINTFSVAPGAFQEPFYIPPPLATTTYFYRSARREGFTLYNAGSNVITIEVEPTSIESFESGTINLFPNPVTTHLQIDFKENNSSNWQIDFFDIKGSLQKTIIIENVNPVQILDVTNLAKGTYLIQLTDLENNKMESFKILKE